MQRLYLFKQFLLIVSLLVPSNIFKPQQESKISNVSKFNYSDSEVADVLKKIIESEAIDLSEAANVFVGQDTRLILCAPQWEIYVTHLVFVTTKRRI